MARGVNKVIIIGNLGTDPDVRFTTSGTAVANLSVATTASVPAGEGNWEEKTEWHRIVAFGKLAENCGNYLSKGRQVYVEGRLQTRQWEDAQGVKRFSTEIIAREIQFLGGGGDQQVSQAQNSQANLKAGSSSQHSNQQMMDELPPPTGAPDDDIPF
ncbi:MAG: single-stranded DNA-binding protein [Syntrophobacteraceae bacterium]